MQEQQQDGKPLFAEARQGFNMMIAIAQVHSRMVEIFLRWPGTWGERFCGLQMVFAWILLFVWSSLFFPMEDPRPMWIFFLIATGGLLLHRVCGLFRNNEEHSLYSGKPIFSLGWKDEAKVKASREPAIVILAGAGALFYSVPMGWYLIWSGIALGVAAGWQRAADQSKIRALRDARIEQEWLMSQQ